MNEIEGREWRGWEGLEETGRNPKVDAQRRVASGKRREGYETG